MKVTSLLLLSLVTLLYSPSVLHVHVHAVDYTVCQSTYQCPSGQVACGTSCYVPGQIYTCANSSLLSIPNAWTDTSTVPNVIKQVPPYTISLNYTLNQTTCSSANSTILQVFPGQELTRNQVSALPSSISWPVNNNSYYTLIVFDPDAPSRTNNSLSPILHYLVINIGGSNVTSGTSILGYNAPSPPIGGGYHRYVWLVFEQPNGQQWPATAQTVNITNRLNFDWYAFVITQAYTVNVGNVSQVTNTSLLPRLSAGTFFQLIADTASSSAVWKDYGIVPQIIPYSPANLLSVQYGSSNIQPADIVPVSQLSSAPNVSFAQANSSAYYTYMILDPDAPTRAKPTSGPILQYLAINVQGNNFNSASSGDVLFPYLQPNPSLGSGYHRYTYIVVSQDNGRWQVPDTTIYARAQFQYAAFLQQTSKAAGTTPYTYVAANFLLAANGATNATASA